MKAVLPIKLVLKGVKLCKNYFIKFIFPKIGFFMNLRSKHTGTVTLT